MRVSYTLSDLIQEVDHMNESIEALEDTPYTYYFRIENEIENIEYPGRFMYEFSKNDYGDLLTYLERNFSEQFINGFITAKVKMRKKQEISFMVDYGDEIGIIEYKVEIWILR